MCPNAGPSKRGVAVSENFLEPGCKLLEIKPVVTIFQEKGTKQSEDSCETVCQHCFKRLETKKKKQTCFSCKLYSYCSKDCRLRDKEPHERECSVLSKLHVRLENKEFMRVVLRLCTYYSTDTIRDSWETMTTHEEEFEEDEQFVKLSTEISELLPGAAKLPQKLVLHILSMAATNSNRFFNERYEDIGTAFDPKFSMINHSCIPNSFSIPTSMTTLTLVATSPVRLGEEVFTSYSPCTFPNVIRKRTLQERYHFKCECELCKQVTNAFFSYRCDNCGEIMYDLMLDNFFLPNNNDIYEVFRTTCKTMNVCNGCSTRVIFTQLQRIWRMHRYILGWLLYASLPHAEQRAPGLTTNVNAFLRQAVLLENPVDVVGLLAERLDVTVMEKEAPTLFNAAMSLICAKICPSFCFPLPVILEHIAHKLKGQDAITAKLQLTFATVAADMSEFKVSRLCYLRNLGLELRKAQKLLQGEWHCRKLPTISVPRETEAPNDDSSSETDEQSFNSFEAKRCLAACSMFFCLQIIALHKHFGIPMDEEFCMENTRCIKSIQNSLFPLKLRGLGPGKVFSISKFVPYLLQLIDMTRIPLRYESDCFSLQFADGKFGPIFVELNQ